MSTRWKAGVATEAITPDEPMWLAGWAARREPGSGKAMDLFAKALALEDANGMKCVIVTVDLIAVSRELATAVAAKISLPREQILFNASHTHCGPEIRPDKVPFFEIPPEFAAKIPGYVAALQAKLVRAIERALSNLQPALLEFRTTSATFAQNRRDPGGPLDHSVPILHVLGEDRKSVAVVFGYACHNLTLPPSFCQYHGDYAGVAQDVLQKELPGTTALFLTGAGADQDPEPRGNLELTVQHGQALAAAVKEALAVPTRPIEGAIKISFDEVPLNFVSTPPMEVLQQHPGDSPAAKRALAIKRKFLQDQQEAKRAFPTTYPCPVQVVQFGKELLLVGLGGEPVVDYAVRLKKELNGRAVWVAGYCNDMFGYLPSARIQAEGGYEGGRALLWSALPAPFANDTEERVIAAVHRLADR